MNTLEQLKNDFTIIKNTTKKGKMIQNIIPYHCDLWNCYKSFSYAKQNAYNYCKNLEEKYEGFNGGIYSYNSTQFTYTFEFKIDNNHYKAYITKDSNYLVEM